jgi:hypothetical protein
MTDVTRETDLTRIDGVPTEKAVVNPQLESVDLEAERLGLKKIRLSSRSAQGSAQGAAIITLLLVLSAAIFAGVAAGLGLSAATSIIVGIAVPVGIYMLVRVTSRNRP